MYDEMLFSVSADKATPVERIDLFDVGLKEHQHLQGWILANPEVLGSKTEIIASAYNRMAAESIRRPRIVLIASDFPPSVTSAVVWLNEQGVDIAPIRYRCYRLSDGQLVVSFSKLFPVPDVEEFTIGRSPSELRSAWRCS